MHILNLHVIPTPASHAVIVIHVAIKWLILHINTSHGMLSPKLNVYTTVSKIKAIGTYVAMLAIIFIIMRQEKL